LGDPSGIWDAAFLRANSSIQNLLILKRRLTPLHQLNGDGVHSGYLPFPTGAVLADEVLFPSIFDEVAGDLALRSTLDFELFEDAVRGFSTGCHAPTRIGDDGGLGAGGTARRLARWGWWWYHYIKLLSWECWPCRSLLPE